MGVSVTGNGFSVGAGATNPGYFDSVGFQLVDDLDLVRGNHQISAGVNWIHTKIETLNNRPTNGQFTFNGQTTGLSMADFMVGSMSGGFLQGNPVYDYDDHDYIGVYVQDDWRVRPNLQPQRRPALGAVHPAAQHLFVGQPLRPGALRPEPAQHRLSAGAAGPDLPRRRRLSRAAAPPQGKLANFAPRVGAIWTPAGDASMSVRASWGIFYDTPHLFFNTRFANNPPWGAQITIPNPAGGFTDPYLGYPGGNPFPALNDNWATAAVPGVRRLRQRAARHGAASSCSSGTSACRRASATGWRRPATWATARVHLWRATELNPAVPIAGATTGNTNQRRVLFLQDPVDGQAYGTIGHVDDTGRGNYHGLLLTLQKRMANNLSVLSNWTISKCMADPGDHRDHRADDRRSEQPRPRLRATARRIAGTSSTCRRWCGRPSSGTGSTEALFSDWQISPIVRWQSGNRSTVTTGVDNALTGMGGQRAVQILDDPYGDGTAANYLNRAAFTSPARRHLQRPGAVHDRQPVELPERHRDHPVVPVAARARCSSAGRSST